MPKKAKKGRNSSGFLLALDSGIIQANEGFRDFILRVMERTGLGTAELARKIGVNSTLVSGWTVGDHGITMSNVRKLIDLYQAANQNRVAGAGPQGSPGPESRPHFHGPPKPTPAMLETRAELEDWLAANPAVAADLGEEGIQWISAHRFTGGRPTANEFPRLVEEFRVQRDAVHKLRVLLVSRHGPAISTLLTSLYDAEVGD